MDRKSVSKWKVKYYVAVSTINMLLQRCHVYVVWMYYVSTPFLETRKMHVYVLRKNTYAIICFSLVHQFSHRYQGRTLTILQASMLHLRHGVFLHLIQLQASKIWVNSMADWHTRLDMVPSEISTHKIVKLCSNFYLTKSMEQLINHEIGRHASRVCKLYTCNYFNQPDRSIQLKTYSFIFSIIRIATLVGGW